MVSFYDWDISGYDPVGQKGKWADVVGYNEWVPVAFAGHTNLDPCDPDGLVLSGTIDYTKRRFTPGTPGEDTPLREKDLKHIDSVMQPRARRCMDPPPFAAEETSFVSWSHKLGPLMSFCDADAGFAVCYIDATDGTMLTLKKDQSTLPYGAAADAYPGPLYPNAVKGMRLELPSADTHPLVADLLKRPQHERGWLIHHRADASSGEVILLADESGEVRPAATTLAP